ncbi:MAG TPA: alpha-2-macroglobulin family protein, partial [Luteolibacter sp.]|nr:alpha-2-macroglobulin family protein [Luteolibacter sp.]
ADAAGVEVENSLSFQVFDPTAKKATAPIPFQLIHSEWTIQPGETYTLLWASGYAEARACVEWFKDGKLLKREWSTPGRTQQTFSWQATEDLRGGFNVRVSQMTMNTHECGELTIRVPWKTKQLALKWEHFTSRLTPGAEETWTAVVSDPAGQAAAAEVVATLYDASLDAYDRHGLPDPGDLLRTEGGGGRIADDHFSNSCDSAMELSQWKTHPVQPSFDRPFHRGFLIPFLSDYEDPFASNIPEGLHWESQLNFNSISEASAPGLLGLTGMLGASGGAMPVTPACPSAFGCDSIVTGGNRSGDYAITANSIDAILNNPEKTGIDAKAAVQAFVAPRRNLAETALFLPRLQSDAQGRVRIHFTVPQSLTTWRFLALAHDSALRSGLLEDSAVGSLDLMVQPNPPRFLREGDELEFPVKIINRSDQAQSGEARLELSDGRTQEDRSAALGLDAAAQPFELAPGESCTKVWRLKIPDGAGVLKYKALAGNERISDGEEGWLPVIARRVLVRDSMSLPIRDAGERKFRFEPLARSKEDPSIESTSLELQVVSQPIWNALQAMPYLMEFPHECAEQTFHRYYANALSSHIVRNHPQIRSTLEEWSKGTPPPDPLGANPQLTGILLQETPWLREAEDPAAIRHRLARLLDEKRMDNELEQTLRKLTQMRCEGGLYPWFAGGSGSEHITLIIATGFARLRAAGVPCDLEAALDAITALDQQICRQHDRILREGKPQDNHLDPTIAHYLYTRSFFLADAKPDKRLQAALNYHVDQANRYWAKLDGRMARAQAAIALQRFGRHETAALITRSLKEHSQSDPDQGRWWNEARGSGWWWHSPIETQAMMIEAFLEVDNDREAVRDCQVWLLRQKQVQDWKTTSATANAIHALLLGDGMPEGTGKPLAVTLGTQTIDSPAAAAGSGFHAVRYSGAQIQADFADITLRKEDAGIAWASIHWQSLRDISTIESNGSEQLSLSKELLVRRNTPDGARLEKPEGPLKVGDEVVSRLVIRNSVAMDYIHLKDPRGSGTEPGISLSGYGWQDNLCYYGSTHDTANHFFIEHLPVGTHVIESSVRIQHAGSYQSGAAEIQCLVAPEFSARSASTKLEATR